MRTANLLVCLAVILATGACAKGEGGQEDPGVPLREAIGDTLPGARWYYQDWAAARAEAERSKRPIFALFRCVP